jgi:Arc/MetJ family transcription regulator
VPESFNCADERYGAGAMTRKVTRVRVDRELADEAVRVLGVKSKTEAARVAVRSLLSWDRRKGLIDRAAEESKAPQSKVKN